MAKRKSFLMYTSWLPMLKALPEENRANVLTMICEYQLGEEITVTDPIALSIFEIMRPVFEENGKRYEARCETNKANRHSKMTKRDDSSPIVTNRHESSATENDWTTSEDHSGRKTDTDNDTDTVTDNDTVSVTSNEVSIIKNPRREDVVEEIVSYLNQRAGTQYRPSSSKTRSLIRARLREGYSADDFKDVIDKKTKEWIGTEREKYLRPETLFGTKFEGYLNQKIRRARDPIEERRSFFADILEG